MSEEPVENIIARVNDLSLPWRRVERCADLTEAISLPKEPDLADALQWDDVRGQLMSVFRGTSTRVGDVQMPAGTAPDVAARCATVLAKAIAAETLPVRAASPEGMLDRLRRHAELVEELTSMFRIRFTGSLELEQT